MRLILVAAVLLVVGGFSAAYRAGAFGDASQPIVVEGAPPPPGKAELRSLARLALEAARVAGDAHPTDAVVVPTTRRVAEQVDAGAPGGPNTPAYFVLVHGRFTLSGVPLPPGAKAPTGTILTLTVDARTNESTDSGLDKQAPDLNAIGKPEPLPLTGVRPTAAGRAAAEIRAARSTNPRLFAIFPQRPREKPCLIPAGAGLVASTIHGTCRTQVAHPVTHGRYPEAFVTFRETWGKHHSSWTLVVRLPAEKVVATRLHGDVSPQLRSRATE